MNVRPGCASSAALIISIRQWVPLPMERSVTKSLIVRVEGRRASDPREDLLAVEEPLEIQLGYERRGWRVHKSVSITMRTPGADAELAAGFLFTEGIVGDAAQIEGIHARDGQRHARRTPPGVDVDLGRLERHFYTTSSCGVCGKASIAALNVGGRNLPAAGRPGFRRRHDPRPAADAARHAGRVRPDRRPARGGDFRRRPAACSTCARTWAGTTPWTSSSARHCSPANRRRSPSGCCSSARGRALNWCKRRSRPGIPILAAVGAPSSLAVELAAGARHDPARLRAPGPIQHLRRRNTHPRLAADSIDELRAAESPSASRRSALQLSFPTPPTPMSIPRPRKHRRARRLQPLARAARRAGHPPRHRAGVCVQRFQAAADPSSSASPSPPTGDWTQSQIAWIFSIAIVFLGASAAVFGKWVERNGPRKTMFASGLCFGGGFAIGALGVHLHHLWLVYFGYGVVGGCGLGLGYIAPVSTLVKWFPDRPGMATGMAIMGFGGGAFIGSNLSIMLMDHFKIRDGHRASRRRSCAWARSICCFALFGAFIVRVPAADWKPAGL